MGVVDYGKTKGTALGGKPDTAAWREHGSEACVEPYVGIGVHDSHAVRPDHPHAGDAADFHQLTLTLDALLPCLRETGRDDHQGLDALLSAIARDVDDQTGGDDDYGKIDGSGGVEHIRVRGHAVNDVRLGVDRVHRSVEALDEEIVEDGRTDASRSAARPDHRYRARIEEAAHRGCGCSLLAALEALESGGRERRRELDLDDSGLELHVHLKAGLPEDLDHLVVLGQDLGLEDRDSKILRNLREVSEENRAEPSSLEIVSVDEGHFCTSLIPVNALQRCMGDYALVGSGRRHEPEAVDIVDLGRPIGGRFEVLGAGEEPKVL